VLLHSNCATPKRDPIANFLAPHPPPLRSATLTTHHLKRLRHGPSCPPITDSVRCVITLRGVAQHSRAPYPSHSRPACIIDAGKAVSAPYSKETSSVREELLTVSSGRQCRLSVLIVAAPSHQCLRCHPRMEGGLRERCPVRHIFQVGPPTRLLVAKAYIPQIRTLRQ
jgi:hypothetical protein